MVAEPVYIVMIDDREGVVYGGDARKTGLCVC